MHGSQLYYKRRHEIDIDKWNQCIDNASNGLIYAYTFYLDSTADNWDALILDDYQAIMPLTWRKKVGFQYLYQPFFTAQLGLFGNNLKPQLFARFLNAIPSTFKLWELSFNHQNLFHLKDFQLYERTNYILDLNQPYDILYHHYRENVKRNISKSVKYGCTIKMDIPIHKIINVAKQQPNAASENDFQKFERLYQLLKQKTMVKTYGVFSSTNELLASCVFTFSNKRAYYILVGNHPNGRTLGASHALVDAFIKDHAEHDLLLDFEGSDIRNLAFFYSSFGAKQEKYSAIKRNQLPWYIKWMKH